MERRLNNFLKELGKIMDEFKVHRIYRTTVDEDKVIEAHLPLSTIIGKSKNTCKISEFLDEYLPFIYFGICYKIFMFRYRCRLKKLFNKYDIKTISSTSFTLHQGIYISSKILHVQNIEIICNLNKVYNIDKLDLEI